MFPGDFQGLAVVLLAIVPGFVATFSWSRAKTWRGQTSDLRTILLSIALSALIHLLVAPLTIRWLYPLRDELDQHPGLLVRWALFTVVVCPVVLGVVAGRWTTFVQRKLGSGRLRRAFAHIWPEAVLPSVWDWLFISNPPYGSFLVLTFKDGSKLAGVFAEGSMAFTSPEQHGLFLISEWELDSDGNIVGEIPGTAGIMVRNVEDIASIRVVKGEDDE